VFDKLARQFIRLRCSIVDLYGENRLAFLVVYLDATAMFHPPASLWEQWGAAGGMSRMEIRCVGGECSTGGVPWTRETPRERRAIAHHSTEQSDQVVGGCLGEL